MPKQTYKEKEILYELSDIFKLYSFGDTSKAHRKLNMLKINYGFSQTEFEAMLKRVGFN